MPTADDVLERGVGISPSPANNPNQSTMDIAIAVQDVAWIALAFVLGWSSRSIGLPPLVGFLAAGFLLNLHGTVSGEMLEKLSDLGITLLLFLVGLKLDMRTIARPQVWAVASVHMSIVVLVLGTAIHSPSR